MNEFKKYKLYGHISFNMDFSIDEEKLENYVNDMKMFLELQLNNIGIDTPNIVLKTDVLKRNKNKDE